MEQIPIGRPEPDNVVPLRTPQPEVVQAPDAEPVAEAVEVPEPEPRESPPPPGSQATEAAPAADAADTAFAGGDEGEDEELSWEEVVARDAAAEPDADMGEGPAPNAELALMIEQIARVGLGLTVGVVDAVAGSLRRTSGEQPAPDELRNEPVEVLTGAALGAAATLAELMAKAVSAASDAVEPAASVAANPPLLGGVSRGAGSALRFLDGTWKAKEADARSSAESFMKDLVPSVTTSALDQIDLTALIRERVDINAIAADIDVDAIVARVDMERVVALLPIDAVLARIDLNEIAERIDVDRIAERLDVEQVLARLDLAGIAEVVIDEIDLPDIIRSSSGILASEAVLQTRVLGISADRFVGKVVDRLLRRHGDRETAVPDLVEED